MSTFNKLTLIGLAGTNGSGKDTVGHILAEKFNYVFFSGSELLRHEARHRGLSVERENLRAVGDEWRRKFGLGVLIDKSIEAYKPFEGSAAGLAIASIRNPGEADRIHELGGTMVWVDADPKLRYERIQANLVQRDRAEEDNRTFEQFLAEEAAEMQSSGDETTLNMSAVKQKCDVVLVNESNDLQELQAILAKKLGL